MERFDEMLKAMAEKEECIVPNGFDERMQEVLDDLPPKAVKRGLGAVKGILIAAAVCAALLCTAFAASPGLREILAEALGGFAPYAQEQEDKTYMMDGFEVKVLSALSDGSTIRAYVQVKDVEGDRLSADMRPWGEVNTATEEGLDIGDTYWSYSFDPGRAVYDAESGTALLVFTSWGQNFGDLKDTKLEIHHIYDYLPTSERGYQLIESPSPGTEVLGGDEKVHVYLMEPTVPFTLNDVQLTIPLTVESMPKLTFGPDSELAAGIGAELAELSPLGLTAAFTDGYKDAIHQNPIRVRMTDGTEMDWECPESLNPSGGGSYYNAEKGLYGTISIWNFDEAIDLDQVESIYMCGKYFSVK